MPTAKILVNGLRPPQIVQPNVLVRCSNADTGGERTYTWTVIDQPAGPPDVLVGPLTPSPSIKPTKPGTYILGLVVNTGTPTAASDSQIFYIPRPVDGLRYPAAGETTEANLIRGWAAAQNELNSEISDVRADPGTFAAVAAVNGMTSRLSVVRIATTVAIMQGLPDQETLPVVDLAAATTQPVGSGALYVLDRGVQHEKSPLLDEVVWVRRQGIVYDALIGGAKEGQPVYLNDKAELDLVPGTYLRQLGTATRPTASTCDVVLALASQPDHALRSRSQLYFGNFNAAPGKGSIWVMSRGWAQDPKPIATEPARYRQAAAGQWSSALVTTRWKIPVAPVNGQFRVEVWKNGKATGAAVAMGYPTGDDAITLKMPVLFDVGDYLNLIVTNTEIALPGDLLFVTAAVIEELFA